MAEVLVFACNWDGWSCVETATKSGLSYPASVKVVKVTCLSRIHAGLILKSFEFGADGVMLLGCEPGKCHFGKDGESIIKEYEKTRSILKMLGIWEGRLVLVQLPAFNGKEFHKQVTKFSNEITHMPAFRGARTTTPGIAQDIEVQSYS